MSDSSVNPDNEGTIPAPTEEVPLPEVDDEPLTLPAASGASTVSHEQQQVRAPDVPGYTPQGPLGRGTYGEVWLYQEDHSKRQVAIKFLTRQTTEQWLTLQAEVLQLVRMDGDPGIVQFKDIKVDAIPPYYLMTYAERGSLADHLKVGPFSVEKALNIFQDLTKSLAYVHAKGVRHCDLKPGNVLLDARDRPLLADFGQALLAENAKQTLGTLYFMAPEQAKPEKSIPDAHWDIYSLGALFYTMLVGNPPRCHEETRKKILNIKELAPRLDAYRKALENSPKPRGHRQLKGMDRPLADIIDRCLSLDPQKRYSDAGAVLEALERRKQMLRLKAFPCLWHLGSDRVTPCSGCVRKMDRFKSIEYFRTNTHRAMATKCPDQCSTVSSHPPRRSEPTNVSCASQSETTKSRPVIQRKSNPRSTRCSLGGDVSTIINVWI